MGKVQKGKETGSAFSREEKTEMLSQSDFIRQGDSLFGVAIDEEGDIKKTAHFRLIKK